MTAPPIQFVDVTKEFKGHRAADSISLEFKSGTTVGLLGPNGAGKTTCLKLMLGLLRPTSGSISILGEDVVSNGPEVRQQIGYVPEDPWLYPWMTVSEVTRFASSMYKNWDAARATELLAQFELPPERLIKQLSKGMRVKAALIVALSHRPRVLVLDEPMSGLDPLMRDDLIETLLGARAENTECIVLSSHQIDDVNRLADEVAIIHAGKLLVHASIDDLLLSTKRVEAVLLDGRLPEKPLPQTVWQNIDRRNWSMTVHPFNEAMLDALQADNPISSARIVDLSVEQIFKDMIRGATPPCFAR
jgi:ABC-2 type transport system ATP-binding protein